MISDQLALPLAGVRVLELGAFIAGPSAASILSSLGADVIKVEHLEGDLARRIGTGGRGMIEAYNRGKRSLSVNLQHPNGMEILYRAIADADVLIHNMRSASAERLGISAEHVHEINPRTVYGSISGYGSATSQRDRAGLDISAQAESGMISLNGEAERPPVRVGFTVVDAASAHVLVQGVVAALFQRERTGQGATVDVPLLHVATQLTAPQWAEYFASGEVPLRKGNGQPGLAPAADLYRTGDGYIVLSAYTDDHWAKLCHLIGRSDLVTDPRFATNQARVSNREEMSMLLEAAFADMTNEECAIWLAEAGIVAGPVRTLDRAFEAPIAHELGIFRQGDEGSWYVTTPYSIGDHRPESASPVPEIGEHTIAVLQELGYSPDQIREHIDSGIVRAHDSCAEATN